MQHWLDLYKQPLNSASSLDEIAQIALEVLRRMKSDGHQIVEICGPITTGGLGDTELNIERFKLAIAKAEEKGLHVFNLPFFQDAIGRVVNFDSSGTKYFWEILELFIKPIFESGFIERALFLPGWQSSVGAKWERKQLKRLGIPIENYPPEWLVE